MNGERKMERVMDRVKDPAAAGPYLTSKFISHAAV